MIDTVRLRFNAKNTLKNKAQAKRSKNRRHPANMTLEDSPRNASAGRVSRFDAAARSGFDEEEIAARFHISVATVRQRLRLTSVSRRLLEFYADDEMKLGQAWHFRSPMTTSGRSRFGTRSRGPMIRTPITAAGC
ncbi:hypothetical protein GOB42_23685 [Sinorhizobium meliloti]|nr:hypothetical protein [Sinorhizobium meliloti]MDW9831866.1 hypothetical protein [Sinorhizobium meliloti]